MADAAHPNRLCPECRQRTDAAVCPVHGIATLARPAPDATLDIQPGDSLGGRYVLGARIGRGGFGTVHECRHTYGIGEFAVKFLAVEGIEDEDLGRFYREAKVTAALQHPNIVRVVDFGQTPAGIPFLVMERLTGETLAMRLHRLQEAGTLPSAAEVMQWATDLLLGLGIAHDAGLVHRDVKPANVFLCSGGGRTVAKLVDFGIAQGGNSAQSTTRRGRGTPAYMSPEQCTNQALDARSDLYAVGLVLFRCVAGVHAFEAAGDLAVMWQHVHQPAPDLATAARVPVSQAFAATVGRALAKLPGDRPADARAMLRGLLGEAAVDVDGAPAAATPATPIAWTPGLRSVADGATPAATPQDLPTGARPAFIAATVAADGWAPAPQTRRVAWAWVAGAVLAAAGVGAAVAGAARSTAPTAASAANLAPTVSAAVPATTRAALAAAPGPPATAARAVAVGGTILPAALPAPVAPPAVPAPQARSRRRPSPVPVTPPRYRVEDLP